MREDRSSIGTGIIMITVGLLFMADRQGWLSFQHLWPLILIVLGVTMLVFPREAMHISTGSSAPDSGRSAVREARRQRSRVSGALWMILVGVLLLLNQNHWMSFQQSWPLFIVAGGLALIFGNIRRNSVTSSDPIDPVQPRSGDAPSGGQ